MRTLTRISGRRRVGYTVAAAATVVALGVVSVAADLTTSASTSKADAAAPPAYEQLTSGFLDKSSSDYFRIDLDKTSADYGHFVIAIPGVGLAWAHGTATVSPHSPTSTTLSFDGPGYLAADAVLDTEFGVNYRPQGDIKDVPVKLRGEIDGRHGTGSINVWIDGTQYHLSAAPAVGGADPVAAQLAASLVGQDWKAVYALADDSLRADMSQTEFVTWIQGELGSGHVDDVTITGDITYTTTSTGISYAQVPVHEAVTVDGQSKSADATLVLIHDQGSWRWLTTK
ncbi:hypothetical protein GCM10009844_30180 [Nocardioides koreensis]|uniref:Uncharacterized protein n=1 Tax=Nocardioides koreensis TaxID=433651 RepID=A0ABP5LM17_9ACTN